MENKPKRKNKTEEIELQRAILDLLSYLKIFAFRNNNSAIYDPVRKQYRKRKGLGHMNGISDILGIYDNKFLAIEVKSKKGSCSDSQVEFLQNVRQRGGIAFVAHSVDDVLSNLKINKAE